MAIRIRSVNGETVALCAARSIEKDGDIYLDDGQHHSLSAYYTHLLMAETGLELADYDMEDADEAESSIISELSGEARRALDNKFILDFNDMYDILKHIPHGKFKVLEYYPRLFIIMEQEESNNENRTWWDQEYGTDQPFGLDKIKKVYGGEE
jgi:hypothetical protein